MENSGSVSTAPSPFSLVWAPIPVISWLYPMIGHLGIALSDGTILDFAVTIRRGSMAFGGPARWVPLQPDQAIALREQLTTSSTRAGASNKSLASFWDEWLAFSAEIYGRRRYAFATDNCHNFVAHFLNSVRYGESRAWDPVRLAWLCAKSGRWVNLHGFIRTMLPTALVLGLGWHLGHGAFVITWCLGLAVILAWFSYFARCCSAQNSPNMLVGV